MRVYAFGCSHITYFYPTWADLLIENYRLEGVKGYNCGRIGSGNQLISTRILEAYVTQKFTSEDIVLVSWSNFFRDDRYHTNEGWHTPGNIFAHYTKVPFTLNSYTYNDEMQWKDLIHFLARDCMLITSTLETLKSTGATVISTHMMNPFDDPVLNGIPETKHLLNTYQKWLEPDICPITNYIRYDGVGSDETRPKYKFKENPKDLIIEDHPLPLEHLKYLKEVVNSKLDVTISNSVDDLAQHWQNKLYENNGGYYPIGWQPKQLEWIVD